MLRIQLDKPQKTRGVGRIILSCGRCGGRGWRGGLRAECNCAVIDARTWTHLVVPTRAFTRRPSAKEVNRAFANPDADGIIRTGDYDVIQVSDGTVVTLYSWTHPERGLVWCLASTNGYNVSRLKWMGDSTYGLLAEYPTFSAAAALGLSHGLLCADNVRLDFKHLDRGRCYTIGFRHPNFHPMTADPSGVWNIQTVDLTTGGF